MKRAGIHRRWRLYGLSLVLILTLMIGSAVSVNAASSIANQTVKASITASGTQALKLQWNKVSGASGYVVYRRESLKKSFQRYHKITSGNTTTYLDRNLPTAKVYQYAVRAYRKEKGKYVYSKYTAVLGATRPGSTTATIKAVSSGQINVSWKSVNRADGYRIYKKANGGKWVFTADLASSKKSYSDKKVSAGTKYVYTVRAYKKAGTTKYLSLIKQSNTVTTPKKTTTTTSHSKFNSTQKEVMKKILYAVETGGQIYGNQKYDDFTEAYTNSSAEHAITIGAGQWYATEAQRLLKLIHTTSPETYKKYDPHNYVWNDVKNADWSRYRIKKSYTRAKIIVKLISSPAGIKCQDQLMYEQIEEYEAEVRKLGVTEIKAVAECINIRHQGGIGSVRRVLAKTRGGYTLDNIYKAMRTDTGNQVGAYRTRQQKVYYWLKNYMK